MSVPKASLVLGRVNEGLEDYIGGNHGKTTYFYIINLLRLGGDSIRIKTLYQINGL